MKVLEIYSSALLRLTRDPSNWRVGRALQHSSRYAGIRSFDCEREEKKCQSLVANGGRVINRFPTTTYAMIAVGFKLFYEWVCGLVLYHLVRFSTVLRIELTRNGSTIIANRQCELGIPQQQ
jgi:hypothetical protein